jgi:hypothetical protein
VRANARRSKEHSPVQQPHRPQPHRPQHCHTPHQRSTTSRMKS